ncbi:MAG: Xaa-Pro peptidase family protein [Brevinematales bacterium]|jgi:Xaa-Pro aminopeptidase
MRNYFNGRLSKLRNSLKDGEALYVNVPEEVFYLTGFTGGDSSLFIVPGAPGVYFITDGRYTEQYRLEIRVEANLEVVKPGRRLLAVLKSLIGDLGIKTLLLSKREISLEFAEELGRAGGLKAPELVNTALIKDMRLCKDDYEIEVIRNNLMITELGYHMILPLIEKGRSEKEVAADLERYLVKNGAKGPSFETIVASGPRSAMPHGTASPKIIENDEVILLDFGIIKDGYCSDFTRCYYLAKIIDPKIREIHNIVLEALKKAESVVKDGVKAGDVHEAASSVIRDAGYGEFFTHSTGHGVGLQVHEAPAVTPGEETVLSEGMIITVEPGIYLPGKGGIRLEDMVLVKRGGCEVLTASDYDL